MTAIENAQVVFASLSSTAKFRIAERHRDEIDPLKAVMDPGVYAELLALCDGFSRPFACPDAECAHTNFHQSALPNRRPMDGRFVPRTRALWLSWFGALLKRRNT